MNSIMVKESSMIRYNYKNSQFNKEIVEPAYWMADRIIYNSDKKEGGVYYTNHSHESNILGVRFFSKNCMPNMEGIKINGQFLTYLEPKLIRSLIRSALYDKTLNGYWLTSDKDSNKSKPYEYKLDDNLKRAYYLLAGIMTSIISHIHTNEDNSIESIRLTTPKTITSKVVCMVTSLFEEIHLKDVSRSVAVSVGYNSKNMYFDEIVIMNEVLVTSGMNSVLEKFVHFLRFIYRTGIISYRCYHVPSAIYESPKAIQDIYMQGIGFMYSIASKFDAGSTCGYVMTSSRSLETSLRHLFDIRDECYRIKYYDIDSYRCTITKADKRTKDIQSIIDNSPHKDADFLEVFQLDTNPTEPCVQIFYEGDYIEVDGLMIPSR